MFLDVFSVFFTGNSKKPQNLWFHEEVAKTPKHVKHSTMYSVHKNMYNFADYMLTFLTDKNIQQSLFTYSKGKISLQVALTLLD